VLDLKPGATAASIAALARQGFYDGLQWHRVVPGFVVQGGDPRGDGAGGPGYTIPCELDLSPYGRGAVGMALSGKDTGGSQWFITLSPQPHLEGHYTVFAQVASGMEVADQLVEGDAILKVTVQAPAPGAPPQLGTGPAGR
jgi:cyclophilin family peptidyl-prolyl cis-trans isomerase